MCSSRGSITCFTYDLVAPLNPSWRPRACHVTQGAINNARLKNSKGVRTSSEMDGVDSTPGGVLLLKMASLTEGEKNAKHLPDRMAFSDEEVVRQGMR